MGGPKHIAIAVRVPSAVVIMSSKIIAIHEAKHKVSDTMPLQAMLKQVEQDYDEHPEHIARWAQEHMAWDALTIHVTTATVPGALWEREQRYPYGLEDEYYWVSGHAVALLPEELKMLTRGYYTWAFDEEKPTFRPEGVPLTEDMQKLVDERMEAKEGEEE